MKVLFIQLILPLVTYAIGVMIGRRSLYNQLGLYDDDIQDIVKDIVDDDSIQHVGYTREQMGYDK